VRFLLAAQLPPRLASYLTSVGHDAAHVQELPDGVRTSDPDIASSADAEHRVVITKDSRFRHSHLVTGAPARLLLVSTGNIGNDDLLPSSATA
jgi:predicted nuclease of predicted toxin-antitoxin system